MSSEDAYARDAYSRRLDRIEEKIDKLSDAVVCLARVEERIGTLEINQKQTESDHRSLNDKYFILTKQVDDNTRTTNFINRLGYCVASAVAVIIATDLWMFFKAL